MKIPNSVRIGTYDYEVQIKEGPIISSDGSRVCYGTISYDAGLIEIDSELQDEQHQKVTFLHEVVHGIVKDKNIDFENQNEEEIVELFAMSLYTLIRDNKEMFTDN